MAEALKLLFLIAVWLAIWIALPGEAWSAPPDIPDHHATLIALIITFAISAVVAIGMFCVVKLMGECR